jgi:hypothetical protein
VRRLAALLLAVGTVALSGACRVDVSVGVDAGSDGGGRVRVTARLDGAAVTQLGGPEPGNRLRLDDLREAGWRIEGPTDQDDGGLEVTATHAFDDAEEAEALLDDVGAMQGFRLEQHRSFFTTTTKAAGTVDLTEGLGAFTDADLEQALGATPEAPLGVPVQSLEKRFGAPIDRLVGLLPAGRLPGKLQPDGTNAPTTAGGTAVWSPALGSRVAVEAESRRWNVRNVLLLVLTLVAGIATAVTFRRQTRLTVTDGNVTLGNHGETGTDEGGAPGP